MCIVRIRGATGGAGGAGVRGERGGRGGEGVGGVTRTRVTCRPAPRTSSFCVWRNNSIWNTQIVCMTIYRVCQVTSWYYCTLTPRKITYCAFYTFCKSLCAVSLFTNNQSSINYALFQDILNSDWGEAYLLWFASLWFLAMYRCKDIHYVSL